MALRSGRLVTSIRNPRAGKGAPDCSRTKLAFRLHPRESKSESRMRTETHRPLSKRERTGKEYGCFPFVSKTKIFKWKINYILEPLPWIKVSGGGKWQNGSSTNITQNRVCMDWVDRPKNYKGLYGILQLLQGSHSDNFPISPQSPRSFWPVAGIESSGRNRFSEHAHSIRFVLSTNQICQIWREVRESRTSGDKARALDSCRRPEGS